MLVSACPLVLQRASAMYFFPLRCGYFMFFPVTTKLLTDHLRQEEVYGRDQPTLLFRRQSLCSDGHLRLASLVHGSSAPSESVGSSKAVAVAGSGPLRVFDETPVDSCIDPLTEANDCILLPIYCKGSDSGGGYTVVSALFAGSYDTRTVAVRGWFAAGPGS